MLECIHCRKDATSSISRAHVFPEALGNSEEHEGNNALVLPPTMVCDRCNQWFGHKVECYFLNHDAGVQRLQWGVRNKRGHAPTLQAIKGSKFTLDGQERMLRSIRMTPAERATAGRSPGRAVSLSLRMGSKPHYSSAFLSKIFIEYIAHQHGRCAALHPGLDHHRKNARQPRASGFLPFLRRWKGDDGPRFAIDFLEGLAARIAVGKAEFILPVFGLSICRIDDPGLYTLIHPCPAGTQPNYSTAP